MRESRAVGEVFVGRDSPPENFPLTKERPEAVLTVFALRASLLVEGSDSSREKAGSLHLGVALPLNMAVQQGRRHQVLKSCCCSPHYNLFLWASLCLFKSFQLRFMLFVKIRRTSYSEEICKPTFTKNLEL